MRRSRQRALRAKRAASSCPRTVRESRSRAWRPRGTWRRSCRTCSRTPRSTHSREGGLTRDLEDSPGGILFRVKDTGIGIPKDAIPKLFTEYFRATNARDMERHGTGLGLALVQRLVRKYGGRTASIASSTAERWWRYCCRPKAGLERSSRESGTDEDRRRARLPEGRDGLDRRHPEHARNRRDGARVARHGGNQRRVHLVLPRPGRWRHDLRLRGDGKLRRSARQGRGDPRRRRCEEGRHQRGSLRLAVFGPHFREIPNVASQVFKALAEAGINILAISTSVSSVTCVFKQERLSEGLASLRGRFEIP